jgi:hypothetical protein
MIMCSESFAKKLPTPSTLVHLIQVTQIISLTKCLGRFPRSKKIERLQFPLLFMDSAEMSSRVVVHV